MTNRLVVVLGCTGTGKSDLAVSIAENFNGEVINADSMQLYNGLDIATNKITEKEMGNVRHHMLSFLEPSCSNFTVFRFREEVLKIIKNLWDDNKLPILVGGTSYYVESVIYENYLIPTDKGYSNKQLDNLSDDELYEYLKKIDSAFVHKNNRFRVKRAIEIYEATGVTKSDHLAKQLLKSNSSLGGTLRFPFTLVFFLDAEKEILNKRLEARVDTMVKRGLREEIEKFYDKYSSVLPTHGINQSIALKEFQEYLRLNEEERRSLRGQKLFEEGCELLKVHTRQYCRKQRSWYGFFTIACIYNIRSVSWDAHLKGRKHRKLLKRKE
ncbi:unnamed protein product [Enterobius vermicularis]|uniref:tRNA dimethylallyltransferase n=1 Tax=Enterobius vermicularis TaxID=51028 RepID=A0A0N4V5N8_ENTVE|nr:unnamed protein product [Enterobius vermicularis]